jgi:hypothetical protein
MDIFITAVPNTVALVHTEVAIVDAIVAAVDAIVTIFSLIRVNIETFLTALSLLVKNVDIFVAAELANLAVVPAIIDAVSLTHCTIAIALVFIQPKVAAAAAVASYMAGTRDWTLLADAAIVAVLPLIHTWFDKTDKRFGRTK